MKKNIIAYCTLLLLFCSCKSLQQLSSKDNTANTPTAIGPSKVEFLDEIEVTPGVKPVETTSEHYTNEKSKKVNPKLDNPNSLILVDALQVKFAPLLNTSYDQLTNISLLRNIDYWWGTRYCMGGTTENCIDCSSFTQTMMRNVYGLSVPRTAQEQYNASARVDEGDIKEGDLVFFHTVGRTRDITHVGIYLTNNKFVHASTSNGVSISDLNDAYWRPKFRGVGRMEISKENSQ